MIDNRTRKWRKDKGKRRIESFKERPVEDVGGGPVGRQEIQQGSWITTIKII